jgi:hypothetical protein
MAIPSQRDYLGSDERRALVGVASLKGNRHNLAIGEQLSRITHSGNASQDDVNFPV